MGKKILLADDSITIQKVIELTFSDEDFEVVTVGNGRLAIEKVQDVRPDVVLCDIIMPEKDGYEVCDFVKKNPSLSHIPVLLLTGAFEPFDQERATRVGCDGFLAKPFEPQALIAKVKDLLRQVEARQPGAAAPAPVAAAPAPPPPAPEPEPSRDSTVWAAPSPVSSPAWEPPQTRPVWTTSPGPVPAPPPPAPPEPSGVNFIPEDPFTDDAAVGFAPSSGETVRVPSFPEETFDSAPEVEPEPYELEGSAPADDLMPMTPDEEESFSAPMTWEAPPAAPEPEPPRPSANADRDLFLEEVFDEAAAAVEAAHAAAAPPAPVQEPHAVPEPEPAHAAAPEPEPEPELPEMAELEPEPEPLPEPEPEAITAPEPVAASPAPAPEPEPERAPQTQRIAPLEPPPIPQPEPQPVAREREFEMADQSFAGVSPLPPAAEPAAAAPPSEAGAVSVPMDMVSQIAQRVVAQISEKVIREIAWEVIPDMAEALIKREIERLTAELHQG